MALLTSPAPRPLSIFVLASFHPVRRQRGLAVSAIALLILGACQGEAGTTKTEPTTTTTPTPEPTTPTGPSTTDPGTTDTPALTNLSARLHDTIQTLVYASWEQTQPGAAHVEYSFDPGVWLSSPVRDLPAGAHEELLLGIPYGLTVTWRVVAENALGATTSADQTIDTPAQPGDIPISHVAINDPTLQDPASPYVFLSLSGPDSLGDEWWVLILDRQGRAVWAQRSPRDRVSMHPRIAKDGRSLYIDHNSFWATFDGGDKSTIDQILIDGTVLTTFVTPGLHHPFTDLPDGSVAYGSMIWPGYATEYLVQVQPAGDTAILWDCQSFLDDLHDTKDFCASNTLNYDDATGKFLFSFWSFESVIQVDMATGQADKWFGHLPGSYAFDPLDSAFWWQHGGHLTDTGTFLTSCDLTTKGVETVVREYEIDDATQTLHEIANFGVGDGVYGYEMGEAHKLANGNYLHNTGLLARLREGTPDGRIGWDIGWDVYAVGRSTTLSDLYALAPETRP